MKIITFIAATLWFVSVNWMVWEVVQGTIERAIGQELGAITSFLVLVAVTSINLTMSEIHSRI